MNVVWLVYLLFVLSCTHLLHNLIQMLLLGYFDNFVIGIYMASGGQTDKVAGSNPLTAS